MWYERYEDVLERESNTSSEFTLVKAVHQQLRLGCEWRVVTWTILCQGLNVFHLQTYAANRLDITSPGIASSNSCFDTKVYELVALTVGND